MHGDILNQRNLDTCASYKTLAEDKICRVKKSLCSFFNVTLGCVTFKYVL